MGVEGIVLSDGQQASLRDDAGVAGHNPTKLRANISAKVK
jgi:hypothetical protein